MYAYSLRCAICALKHAKLLDAAHIVADSKGGSAQVSNGLSLCKLHHGAFDAKILGVTPSTRSVCVPMCWTSVTAPC